MLKTIIELRQKMVRETSEFIERHLSESTRPADAMWVTFEQDTQAAAGAKGATRWAPRRLIRAPVANFGAGVTAW